VTIVAWPGKARLGKARLGKARLGKARHGKARIAVLLTLREKK
jgi:hypothetical protein